MGCCHSIESKGKPPAFFAFGKVRDLHERSSHSTPPADPVDFIATLTQDKPLDGSDVQNLKLAKKQIIYFRKCARHFLDNLPLPVEEEFLDRKFCDDVRRSAIYQNEDCCGASCGKFSVVHKSDEIKQLITDSIKTNVLFEDNNEEEILHIVDVFRPVSFKKGDTVINQGEVGDNFFVVESGELTIRITVGEGDEKSEVIGGTYRRGSAFGELALIFGSPRAATVMATKACQLWCLDRYAYRGVVSQIRFNNRREKLTLLTCNEIGQMLDKTTIEDLSLTLKPEKFSPGDVILREGEDDYTIYFIRSGFVEKRRRDSDDRVEEISQNDSFGLASLLNGGYNDATYVASTSVSVYFFTKNDFESMVGNIHDVLEGKQKSRSVIRLERKSSMEIEANQRVVLGLNQLNYFNQIGRGDFSDVTLVQSKESGEMYALKAFSKHFIVHKGQQSQLLNEFRILRDLDHPNIGKIHCAMQDEKKVYFLLDLLPGGEILSYLMQRGKMSEDETRFYVASVVLALDHTACMMIAHRGIKPENLMLDRKGYCVLVDFALAKEVTQGQTFTFCGTPDYLAPEIIRGTGHDWGVDCWALGVLMFELSFGTAPFYSPNHLKRTRKILKGYSSANLPGGTSNSFGCLVSQLLVANQSNRLGRTRNGIKSIKNHRWFAGFDWQGLLEKSILVPIEPSVQTDITVLGRRDIFSKNVVNDSQEQESDWWPNFSTI